MIIGCNVWMICLELIWIIYDLSRTLQLSEFVWTLRSPVWVELNHFLLIDAKDKSKISSDHHRILFDVSYTAFYFSRTIGIIVNKISLKIEERRRYSFKKFWVVALVKIFVFSWWLTREGRIISRRHSGYLIKMKTDTLLWV